MSELMRPEHGWSYKVTRNRRVESFETPYRLHIYRDGIEVGTEYLHSKRKAAKIAKKFRKRYTLMKSEPLVQSPKTF